MSIETIILLSTWVIATLLLLLFVPKDKIRKAIIIILFHQTMTWPIGIAVVELNLIQYPVRLFEYAVKISFTFEYFIYPVIAVLFVLYYPRDRGRITNCLYYIAYSSTLTIIEIIFERYTLLIKYVHWHWYWTWSSIIITLFITRKFYLWFHQIPKPKENE